MELERVEARTHARLGISPVQQQPIVPWFLRYSNSLAQHSISNQDKIVHSLVVLIAINLTLATKSFNDTEIFLVYSIFAVLI